MPADRPRRRRDPDDSDWDDERPRHRRRDDSADGEREVRPRRRRHNETEFQDDRPRRREKRKSPAFRIGLFAAGSIAFLAVVALILNLLGVFRGSNEVGIGSTELACWVPAFATSVEYVDVTEASKVPGLLETLRPDVAEAESYGLKIEEMATYQLARGNQMDKPAITAIKLRVPVDRGKVLAATKGQEAAAIGSGKVYYKVGEFGGLYFASDTLVIFAADETNLAIHLKDEGKMIASAALVDCLAKTSGAVRMAALEPFHQPLGTIAAGFGAQQFPIACRFGADVSGTKLSVRVELNYVRKEHANAAAMTFDDAFKFARDPKPGAGGNADRRSLEQFAQPGVDAKASAVINSKHVAQDEPRDGKALALANTMRVEFNASPQLLATVKKLWKTSARPQMKPIDKAKDGQP